MLFRSDSLELSSSNILFTNQSQNAVSYHWDFGDSSTSTFISGFHQYADTGSYYVTLIAIGMNGCADTVVHGPWIIVPPVFYFIPNAFTPNVAGYYQVNATIGFDATSVNPQWGGVAIYKNGAVVRQNRVTGNTYTSCAAPVSSVVYLNGSTDYIESYVYCGTNSGYYDNGQQYTCMSGMLIRAGAA